MGRRFAVLKVSETTELGPVYVAESPEGDLVTLWPWSGVAPVVSDAALLAQHKESGFIRGVPYIAEDRLPGISLMDLALPLHGNDAARLLMGLVSALRALEASGLQHGAIGLRRVLMGAGRFQLVGSGLVYQDHAPDLPASCRLLSEVSGVHIMVETVDELEEMVEEIGDPETTMAVQKNPALEPTGQVVELSNAGSFDEIGPSLHRDERGVGLLDRWNQEETSAGERTGTLDAERELERRRLVLLARLAAGPTRAYPSSRFTNNGQPVEQIRRRLLREPIDPLPSPDIVPIVPQVQPPTDQQAEVTLTAIAQDATMERTVPHGLHDEHTATAIQVRRPLVPDPPPRPAKPTISPNAYYATILLALIVGAVLGFLFAAG